MKNELRVRGPLCLAWEHNRAGDQRWDECTHDSCWAIVTGKVGWQP
jgi:hypothetical protein